MVKMPAINAYDMERAEEIVGETHCPNEIRHTQRLLALQIVLLKEIILHLESISERPK